MNKPSGPSKPPHDGEEAASRAYEKKLAIERSIEPSDNSDQPFLTDPSDETGAEPSGGGYGAAMPPDDSSPPAVIPPTPKPTVEPPRPGAFEDVTEVEIEAGKIGVAESRKALKAANNPPPKKP